MKTGKIIIVSLITIAIYVLSYLALKNAKPEGINTNDGPIELYQALYFPLRYIDSEAPDFFNRNLGKQKIKVSVEWINEGNGYLYFEWENREYRAGLACDNNSIVEGDIVILEIEYGLLTYDDFRNHLIPYIVNIRKV